VRTLVKRQPLRAAPVDLNEIIRDVIAMVRHELHRSGVSLETRLAQELPAVPGDRVQLQQLVLNLILNAIEATREIEGRSCQVWVASRFEAGTCTWRSATPASGWRRIHGTGCSRRSTRRSRVASAWGSRSAGRSSKRTAGESARWRIRRTARSSAFGCPWRPRARASPRGHVSPRPGVMTVDRHHVRVYRRSRREAMSLNCPPD
jgi:signal transduction histidine kinase